MAALGFTDQEAIAEYLNQTDINNVLALGYMGKDCFPRAMGADLINTLRPYLSRFMIRKIAHSLENIGGQVYEREADVSARRGRALILFAGASKALPFDPGGY